MHSNQTNIFGMFSVMLHSLNNRTCRAAGATQPDTAQFEIIQFKIIVHLNYSASGNRNNSIYPISVHYLRVWKGHISSYQTGDMLMWAAMCAKCSNQLNLKIF